MTVQIDIEALVISQDILLRVQGFYRKYLWINKYGFGKHQVEFRQRFLRVRRQEPSTWFMKRGRFLGLLIDCDYAIVRR